MGTLTSVFEKNKLLLLWVCCCCRCHCCHCYSRPPLPASHPPLSRVWPCEFVGPHPREEARAGCWCSAPSFSAAFLETRSLTELEACCVATLTHWVCTPPPPLLFSFSLFLFFKIRFLHVALAALEPKPSSVKKKKKKFKNFSVCTHTCVCVCMCWKVLVSLLLCVQFSGRVNSRLHKT